MKIEERNLHIFYAQSAPYGQSIKSYGYDENFSIYSFSTYSIRDHKFADKESIRTIKELTECDDVTTIAMAARRAKDGISIEDFKEIVREMDKIRSKNKSEFEQFFTIKGIRIERETGNINRGTFDFIRVDVGVPRYKKDKMKFIKKHIKELNKRIIEKIQNSKKFQKFGVPVNFLKITNITLRNDDLIEYTLELKEVDYGKRSEML